MRSVARRILQRLALRLCPELSGWTGKLPASMVNSHNTVDRDAGYLYTRIPKAANSTIVCSLSKSLYGVAPTSPDEIIELKNSMKTPADHFLSRRAMGQLLKFTFVRNPGARFLSAYQEKINRRDGYHVSLVRSFLGINERRELSVDEFLGYLEAGGLYSNAHWCPQVDLLLLAPGDYDFIGRVEQLETDLTKLLDRLCGSGQGQLVTWDRHATRNRPEKKALTPAQAGRVRKLYEADYAALGYTS